MSWDQHLHAYADYMSAAGLARRTRKLRVYYLRRLATHHPDPWTVCTADLVAWMAEADWAPETKRSAREALRGFYAWACTFDLLTSNPAARLPSVKVPRGRPRPAPDSVLEGALRHASDRDRLMLLLAACAGLRRAEIASLRWADVTPLGLHITGKGGRQRTIPLSAQLGAELDAECIRRQAGQFGTGWRYRLSAASPHVFPGLRKPYMHPDAVGPVMARLLGSGCSAHTLRHRFATKAYQGTQDLRAVQELMGHSSPVTTARYVLVGEAELRAAVDAAA